MKKRKNFSVFAEAFFFASKQLRGRGSCLGSIFALLFVDPVGNDRTHNGADIRTSSISLRLEGGVLGLGEDDPNLDFVARFAESHIVTPLPDEL